MDGSGITLHMTNLLEKINLPDGLKNMNAAELELLAAEIRDLLVDAVMKSGGHLASNLGVVELTLALYTIFDFPNDKIIWDVGHQSYIHKILSGRGSELGGMRLAGGISGFPKREESPFDSFNTGHSSTSISAALGIARARDINGDKYRVVTVTGDGALTGGLCYEAMNDAGRSANDLIVVLNDNKMSISGNVGSVSRHLSRIRSLPFYFTLRDDIHSSLNGVPVVGRPLASFISKAKSLIKYAFIPGVIFEELGFRYIGPVDGHNVAELLKIFRGVASMRGPVLVHVLTKKGMGYPEAEADPQKYHCITPAFQNNAPTRPRYFSNIFGNELCALAKTDKSIVAISAAMTEGTGLNEFEKAYPKRFFDVGIAEQHALTLAAGMSLYGLKPVAALYSTFLQRAYDQLFHDICLQNAHVVVAVDRAGIVGEDGETHQGVYDIAYLRHMPNLTVMAPAYDGELSAMLKFALYETDGPVAIRYPKGVYTRESILRKLERLRPVRTNRPVRSNLSIQAYRQRRPDYAKLSEFRELTDGEISAPLELGRGELLLHGADVTIVAVGATLEAALDAAAELIKRGCGVDLISARFIKPLDAELIVESVKKTGKLLVAEDGCIIGGFGGAVAELLAGVRYDAHFCGFPDKPIEQGKRSDLLHKYGLSGEALSNAALELIAAPYAFAP